MRAWFLLPLLAACVQPPAPPEARFLGGSIRGLDPSGPALLLDLQVEFRNPNPFPLPLSAFGTRLRVGEVTLPLDLNLPPGPSPQTLPLRLSPGAAFRTVEALLSPQGVPVVLEGQVLGRRYTFFEERLAFPLAPPRVRRAGLNLFLENPNSLPLKASGQLYLLGQAFRVEADLPPKGEGQLRLRGFRPGLDLGGSRLELDLEVPGLYRYRLTLGL